VILDVFRVEVGARVDLPDVSREWATETILCVGKVEEIVALRIITKCLVISEGRNVNRGSLKMCEV
jgi:hypothetical protein